MSSTPRTSTAEAGSPRGGGDLRSALARLLSGDEVPSYVKSDIRASWRRAVESGLAPERVRIPFDPDVDSDGALVRAAAPVLDQLAIDLVGTNVGAVLSDARGHLVDRRVPDRSLLEELDRIQLAPGYVYAEQAVGTNGVGTALAQRRPSAVEGEEHFAEALTTVACSGAPITDPRSGRVVGCVDLTSLASEGSALMLPLVTRAAHEVEQRLLDDGAVWERIVLQRFLQEGRRARGPLVLVTDGAFITNAAAARLVEQGDEPTLRACAARVLAGDHEDASTVALCRGETVAVRCEPIADHAGDRGAILRLRVVGDDAAPAFPSPGGRPTLGWSSLTETERSVADLVAQGSTNKEAADGLFLSRHTVGFHLRSIYRKLGVSSRVELTRVAFGLSRS